ncbi:MAG: dockerin type I repeat-containing protein [Oscillospiraceae bacterium]|nr:dockerin type I repeat-containing protein [Oscillospiraceae bacterium]
MMKKRLLAALTALCCVSSMAAMPVSALPHRQYVKLGSNGLGYFLATITTDYVILDMADTENAEELAYQFPGCKEVVPFAGFQPATYCDTWYEVEYTPSGNAYVLTIDENSIAEFTAYSRAQLIEQEDIYNVSFISYDLYGVAFPIIDFTFEFVDPSMKMADIKDLSIPELEGFDMYDSLAIEAGLRCTIQEGSQNPIRTEIEEKGLGGYDLYVYLEEYGQSIVEKYNHIFSDVMVNPALVESTGTPEGISTSIWNTAGDLDTDGKIDASDAAELLALSAMKGATVNGGADPFTAEQKSAADLNGDTFCDANDAAYILQFAAEAGAGSELTIGEFMTR